MKKICTQTRDTDVSIVTLGVAIKLFEEGTSESESDRKRKKCRRWEK